MVENLKYQTMAQFTWVTLGKFQNKCGMAKIYTIIQKMRCIIYALKNWLQISSLICLVKFWPKMSKSTVHTVPLLNVLTWWHYFCKLFRFWKKVNLTVYIFAKGGWSLLHSAKAKMRLIKKSSEKCFIIWKTKFIMPMNIAYLVLIKLYLSL